MGFSYLLLSVNDSRRSSVKLSFYLVRKVPGVVAVLCAVSSGWGGKMLGILE